MRGLEEGEPGPEASVAEARGDPLAAMGARLAGSPQPGRPGRGGDRPV